MAAVNAPLDELRDIVAAPPPGWWPPAPIWWLIAATAALAAVTAGVALYRRLLRYRRRRAALNALAACYRDWQRDGDAVAFAAALSALLKRAALEHHPRAEIAARWDRDWLRFIFGAGRNDLDTLDDADAARLTRLRFQRPDRRVDAALIDRLYRAARTRLRQL